MLAAGDKSNFVSGGGEFGAKVAADRAAAHYRDTHEFPPIGRDCNLGSG